ncbi:hypothetical protein VTN02DRAFT_4937 [Thermoascus thermophilus]
MLARIDRARASPPIAVRPAQAHWLIPHRPSLVATAASGSRSTWPLWESFSTATVWITVVDLGRRVPKTPPHLP